MTEGKVPSAHAVPHATVLLASKVQLIQDQKTVHEAEDSHAPNGLASGELAFSLLGRNASCLKG